MLAATVAGAWIPGSPLEPYFSLSRDQTIVAIAAYGFVASVLPVWLLLCPRDYLSSFLKIGTIALLVVGVIVANPKLEAPAINPHFATGGGPVLRRADLPLRLHLHHVRRDLRVPRPGLLGHDAEDGRPRESDIRMIGYGAMLMEGLVGVVALIAAAALPNAMYYDINIDLAKRPEFLPSSSRRSTPTTTAARGRPRRASSSRWRRTSRSRSTAGPAGR